MYHSQAKVFSHSREFVSSWKIRQVRFFINSPVMFYFYSILKSIAFWKAKIEPICLIITACTKLRDLWLCFLRWRFVIHLTVTFLGALAFSLKLNSLELELPWSLSFSLGYILVHNFLSAFTWALQTNLRQVCYWALGNLNKRNKWQIKINVFSLW